MSFKQSKSVRSRVGTHLLGSTETERLKASQCKSEAKEILIDYLLTHGYTRSLQMFKIESAKHRKDEESVQDKLLSLMGSNSRVEFWNKFRKELGRQIRQNEEEFRRLEFFLHIYFLVTTRKEKSFESGAMAAFKGLLESKGKYLSEVKEFLPYFALPYIQDPTSHPVTIAQIFKPEWLQSIKAQLISYLDTHLKESNESKLEILLKNNGQKQNTASFEASSTRQTELLHIIEQSQSHYKQLQSNYRQMINSVKENLVESQAKWFNLAKQLIQITKKFVRVAQQNNLVSGQMLGMMDKIKKYELFLNSNVDDVISNSMSISVFDQPTYEDIQNQSVSKMMKKRTSINMLSLNYEKIKHSLINEDDISVCLLLQAMRWRVTKTTSAYGRREIITGYTVNDILGLKIKGFPMLERLLSVETPENVKEQALRLLNTIESDYEGRSYIVDTNMVLEKIVQTLKTESYDGIIRRLALNALQKLSLRPQVQLYCVQHNIISWIVETIKFQREQLSEMSFKYLTAILLNMTLKKIGRNQCGQQQILQLLINLLDIDSNQIRTYVSGSIYSLISSSKINEQGRRIGMLGQLNSIKQNSSSQQFVVQLNHIINKIERRSGDVEESVIDDDEENDVDDLLKEEEEEEDNEENNEVEEENDIEGTERMDKGEPLLFKKYSCGGPEAIRQEYLTRSILDDAIVKNSLQVSMIKEKKSLKTQNNKSTIPARSTLQLIQAIHSQKPLKQNNEHQPSILIEDDRDFDKQEYDSKKYLIKHKNFRKRNLVVKGSQHSEESIQSPQGKYKHL